MYVEKTRTWNDNWNDVIRDVLYPDERLKELMCVPEGTSIVDFIKDYFIEDAATDALLTTEQVRILYYDSQGRGQDNKDVRLKYKEFDIYVHDSVLHTASNDRLKGRDQLIAERLKYL